MTKLILDLDTGIDDALALMYALASPEAEVTGITGTFGNVTVETGVHNDLTLLALLGRPDIPVFAGPRHPSDATSFSVAPSSERYHAANGLGGARVPAGAVSRAQDTDAVDFILEATQRFGPDELTVVACGSLTTIDAVFARDPTAAGRTRVVMMGGALTVPGNVTPCAEANISQDPAAADRVFRAGADLTMVGLDATECVRLMRADVEHLAPVEGAVGAFVRQMLDYYIRVTEEDEPDGLAGCCLHDPLAVAVALDPSLVTTIDVSLRAETEGVCRGRTIGEIAPRAQGRRPTRVAIGVDAERFLEQFAERVSRLLHDVARRET